MGNVLLQGVGFWATYCCKLYGLQDMVARYGCKIWDGELVARYGMGEPTVARFGCKIWHVGFIVARYGRGGILLQDMRWGTCCGKAIWESEHIVARYGCTNCLREDPVAITENGNGSGNGNGTR